MLCAGTPDGEGRVAPVCAPAPSERLSTGKAMVFEAILISVLFVISVLFASALLFAAQA
jgi:hypothetical protein